jgi:hypothetical protein
VKRGTVSESGFDPNPASQPLHSSPANRQADSGSRLLRSVQAPENPKDVIEVLGIDANPVILNGKNPAVLAFLC